mgnify:CR=1 FL=1
MPKNIRSNDAVFWEEWEFFVCQQIKIPKIYLAYMAYFEAYGRRNWIIFNFAKLLKKNIIKIYLPSAPVLLCSKKTIRSHDFNYIAFSY